MFSVLHYHIFVSTMSPCPSSKMITVYPEEQRWQWILSFHCRLCLGVVTEFTQLLFLLAELTTCNSIFFKHKKPFLMGITHAEKCTDQWCLSPVLFRAGTHSKTPPCFWRALAPASRGTQLRRVFTMNNVLARTTVMRIIKLTPLYFLLARKY